MRSFLAAGALSALALPASAQTADYMDDRSTPQALVRSLYNAVNRREYARAWSYFGEKPAQSLDAYAQGYAGTEAVAVRTGLPRTEGAAGSVFHHLPVAIEARAADGSVQVFGGCYELRLADPQIQSEDFSPLHIVGGSLAPTDDSIYEAVPQTCGEGALPDPGEDLARQARVMFADGFGTYCMADEADKTDPENTGSWVIDFAYSYEEASAPTSQATLFRFLCNRGAYNESHVYLLHHRIGGLRPVGFATPELDIRYQDDDYEKPVESIVVKGFRSVPELVNSDFDPTVLTVSSWSKWRGIGDASTVGTWIFRDGEFALVRYDVDASYDGEIEHETVIDYHSGP